ncbi:hypothetical protein VTO42DRAFT_8233 [Malbranchea cinnamomea]
MMKIKVIGLTSLHPGSDTNLLKRFIFRLPNVSVPVLEVAFMFLKKDETESVIPTVRFRNNIYKKREIAKHHTSLNNAFVFTTRNELEATAKEC